MFHIIDFEGLNVYNGELGVMNAIVIYLQAIARLFFWRSPLLKA